MSFRFTVFKVAGGYCAAVASPRGLCRFILPVSGRSRVERSIRRLHPGATRADADFASLRARVRRCLGGGTADFSGLKLDVSAGTEFQRRIWKAARGIPFGRTRTYSWVACAAGKPRAARAAGSALAVNPIPLIVPCHRVIRSGGAMGGFSAPGGASAKRAMIRREREAIRKRRLRPTRRSP